MPDLLPIRLASRIRTALSRMCSLGALRTEAALPRLKWAVSPSEEAAAWPHLHMEAPLAVDHPPTIKGLVQTACHSIASAELPVSDQASRKFTILTVEATWVVTRWEVAQLVQT